MQETPINAPSLEISFDNILAEHLAAERLYYRSTLFWKLDKIVAVILFCMGVLASYYAGLRWWTVIWFPLAIAEWFNALSLKPLQIRYVFKHNPKFRENYHLTFEEDAIHFQTPTIDSRVRWDHFDSFLEDDRLFLLIYGTRMYSIIPKRAFRSETEQREFRSLIARKIGRGHMTGSTLDLPGSTR